MQIFDSDVLESMEEVDLSNLELSRNTVTAILRSKNIERMHRLSMVNILTPADLLKVVMESWQRLAKLESIKVHTTKGLPLEDLKKLLPNLQFVESRDVKESPENL